MKFTYLRSYLRGYASKVIQHLLINDENYSVAIELLESEFLDRRFLVDEFFRKLLDSQPKFDNEFLGTKLFINEIRCILSDLKTHKFDLLCHPASKAFISHLVFRKLPVSFKQELVRKLGDNFPEIDAIFENYAEIVRTLTLRPRPLSKPKFDEKQIASKPILNNSLLNAENKNFIRRSCEFCQSEDYLMVNCKK